MFNVRPTLPTDRLKIKTNLNFQLSTPIARNKKPDKNAISEKIIPKVVMMFLLIKNIDSREGFDIYN